MIENENKYTMYLICIILGFILWLIFEKILDYINNRGSSGVGKNQKYNLPSGPTFYKWFFNYLFNYYDLKETAKITYEGRTIELIEDTSEKTVLKWFNQYDCDNYCVSFFGRPMIFTRDISISKYILSSQNIDKYNKPPDESGVLIRLAKNSILMSERDEWRYHRSIISQPFSSKNVKLMVPTIIETVDKLIDKITSSSTGSNSNKSIDIHSYCTKLTFDIIGKLSIGFDFGSISKSDRGDDEDSNLSKQFDFILNEMIRPIRRFSSYLPLYNDIKLFKCLNRLETIIKNGINSRKSNINDHLSDKEYKKNYLLDNLINDNVNEKDIIGNINTFLLAGHETSANLLTFIFYLISTHQDIQDDLYKQLIKSEVCGDNKEFQSNELIDWIIYETLRLFPPAPMIGRTACFDDTIECNTNDSSSSSGSNGNGSYKIPKDTLILISVYAIHRNPKLWPQPNQFNPYRWKNIENVNNRSDFIPFSSGARVCSGQKFAIAEARIIISKLILSFNITYDKSQSHPFTIYQRATLTPKYPVQLIFKKR